MWIFLFDSRERNEVEALQQVRSGSSALFDLLLQNANAPGNYIAGLSSYLGFAQIIAAMMSPFGERVPEYINWREQTEEVTRTSIDYVKVLDLASRQMLAGNRVNPPPDEQTRQFHTTFVSMMESVDASIQYLDWAGGVRRSGVRKAESTIGISALTLVGSIVIALLSSIELGSGFSNKLNVYWGSLLVVGIVGMCVFLVQAFIANSVSRRKWIDRKIRKLAKERKPAA